MACTILLMASRVVAETPGNQTNGAVKPKPSPVMEPAGTWFVHDEKRTQPKVVTPGVSFSQGAPAPSDAGQHAHGLLKSGGCRRLGGTVAAVL